MPNWKKIIVSGSDASLNTLTVSNGITGSLFGTASWATNALTANNGGVTKILAGANVNLSPVNGLGDVTITSFGTNLYNTATGSYGSFYDTGSVAANSATAIYSMSLNTTDISNGVFISASNGDNTRVKFTNAGTYNIQFSSQFSNTDNSNQDVVIWIRKNGTDIPDSSGTAAVPPFKAGSNGQIIASWNYYLSLAANDFIQLCWHVEQANVITLETIAAGTSPTHPRTPSTILTAQRVDTFLSNTGSFSGSFTGILTGTASYATQALSASFAPLTPAFPFTGSAIITGSLNVIGNTQITGSLSVSSSLIASGSRVYVGPATYANTPTGSGMDIVGPNQSNNYQGTLEIFSNTTGADNGGSILLGGMQTGPTMYGLAKIVSGYVGSGYGGYLSFWTEAASSTLTEKMRINRDGLVGIGVTTPTAVLHLKAGAAAASSAPIKLTAGTNLTTPEAGAVEFDGNSLFLTTGSLRSTILTNTNPASITGSAVITGSLSVIGNTTMTGSFNVSGSVRLNGNAGVTIIGNTTVTGSLTVSSSIGVTGSINVKRTTAGSCGIFENNSYNLGGGPPILVKDGLNSLGLGYGSATAYFYTPNDGLYIHGYGNYGTFFETGNVVIPNKLQVGSTNTTTGAKIHIAAGTATALTAPIKLTAGTNMTTPEAGAVEFNGTNLFFTTGSTRSTILTNTNPASISGNLILTGSLLVSGSVRLNGNAGVNITGNTVITGSLGVTGGITGSLQGTASYATQALSASYAPSAGGVAFPFTGSAIITGSLNVIGNTAITGSLVAGYNPTPLEGTIQDGVTSVLGDLNNWNSDFYQGTVLYSETAGGTIGFGQLCYRTMFETWELADATVASETSFNMLGICVRHSVSGSATSILINGFVETTYVTIGKSGEPLYMDTTSGSINATPPTSVGNVVRLIGNTFWTSNTNAKIIIHFNPDRSWIEL